jgi:hypothetical protein
MDRNGPFACSAAGPIWKGERLRMLITALAPPWFPHRWVDAPPVKCLSSEALEAAVLATAPILHVIGYTPEALGHDMFGRYERQVELSNGRAVYLKPAEQGAPQTRLSFTPGGRWSIRAPTQPKKITFAARDSELAPHLISAIWRISDTELYREGLNAPHVRCVTSAEMERVVAGAPPFLLLYGPTPDDLCQRHLGRFELTDEIVHGRPVYALCERVIGGSSSAAPSAPAASGAAAVTALPGAAAAVTAAPGAAAVTAAPTVTTAATVTPTAAPATAPDTSTSGCEVKLWCAHEGWFVGPAASVGEASGYMYAKIAQPLPSMVPAGSWRVAAGAGLGWRDAPELRAVVGAELERMLTTTPRVVHLVGSTHSAQGFSRFGRYEIDETTLINHRPAYRLAGGGESALWWCSGKGGGRWFCGGSGLIGNARGSFASGRTAALRRHCSRPLACMCSPRRLVPSPQVGPPRFDRSMCRRGRGASPMARMDGRMCRRSDCLPRLPWRR